MTFIFDEAVLLWCYYMYKMKELLIMLVTQVFRRLRWFLRQKLGDDLEHHRLFQDFGHKN